MLKQKIEDKLDRLAKEGVITPVASSPWAAPVVKLDGMEYYLFQKEHSYLGGINIDIQFDKNINLLGDKKIIN